MSEELLSALEVGAEDDATHVVFWLHGLGDSGHGHRDVVDMLPLPEALRVRFVLPHAPSIPVTLNGGLVMPAWYDVYDLGPGALRDVEGLQRSAWQLAALVARENERGIPCERMVLAGFSQGGAVATWLALRHSERFAGAIALSTYMMGGENLPAERHEANATLPFLMAHGSFDPMVPCAAGSSSRTQLEELGHAVEWHEYPMQHEVCMDEIRDVGDWLGRLLT